MPGATIPDKEEPDPEEPDPVSPDPEEPDPEEVDATASVGSDGPETLESEQDAMTKALAIAGSDRNSLARIIGGVG
jgi:hypothetical protein